MNQPTILGVIFSYFWEQSKSLQDELFHKIKPQIDAQKLDAKQRITNLPRDYDFLQQHALTHNRELTETQESFVARKTIELNEKISKLEEFAANKEVDFNKSLDNLNFLLRLLGKPPIVSLGGSIAQDLK